MNKTDTKCFQYIVTVALNHEEIKRDFKTEFQIKPFVNKYNCKGIHFPSEKDYLKTN